MRISHIWSRHARPAGTRLCLLALLSTLIVGLLTAFLPHEVGVPPPGPLDIASSIPWDRDGQLIGLSLLPACHLTLSITAIAMAVSLAAATLVALVTHRHPTSGTLLRCVALAASSLPAVALAPLAQSQLDASVWIGGLVLGLCDLTLAGITAPLSRWWCQEQRQPWVRAMRARGASPAPYTARRLVVFLAESARARLPVLLSGALVVEMVFPFDARGLATLVIEAIERDDPNVLLWITLLCGAMVEAMAWLAASLHRTLTPTADIAAPEASIEAPAPVLQHPPLAPQRPGPALHLRDLPKTPAPGVSRTRTRPRWLPGARTERLALWFLALPLAVLLVTAVSGWRPHDLDALPEPHHFNASPSLEDLSLLGRSSEGEDVLSLILRALALSLGPLITATLIAVVAGTLLGTCWGAWPRSPPGRCCGMLLETLDTVPRLLIILTAAMAFDPSAYLWKLVPVIGLTLCPLVATAVRAAVKDLVARPLPEALRAVGVSRHAIIWRHLLWNNARGAVVIAAAECLSFLVLFDVTLGYLGYGQPDHLSLGGLVARGIADVLAAPDSASVNSLQAWGPLLTATLSIAVTFLAADNLRSRNEEGLAP